MEETAVGVDEKMQQFPVIMWRVWWEGETASVVWWLACWPVVPELAGSNPAEAVHEKILSMPSFGGEVKESVPCPSYAACKRT
jgi:hypothetical protein